MSSISSVFHVPLPFSVSIHRRDSTRLASTPRYSTHLNSSAYRRRRKRQVTSTLHSPTLHTAPQRITTHRTCRFLYWHLFRAAQHFSTHRYTAPRVSAQRNSESLTYDKAKL